MVKLLSVVIPAKNEEKTVGKCIESVLVTVQSIDTWEVLLVDSYSSDNTVKIAERYPIKILRLKKDWFKSPHAGRYIGTIKSKGKYVFFLDADMVVCENWTKTAIEILEKDNNLAGITGVIYNIFPNEVKNANHPIKRHPLGFVEHLPGPAIFRREALNEVNHFNPYFKGFGEKELGYRLSNHGYKQLRISETIAYQYKKKKNINEIIEKSSYFRGVGQFLRLHFNRKTIFEIYNNNKMLFAFQACLLLYLLFLISFLIFNKKIFLITNSVLIVFLLLEIFKHRNIKNLYYRFNALLLKSINFFYGFFNNTKTVSDYPLDAEIVKWPRKNDTN